MISQVAAFVAFAIFSVQASCLGAYNGEIDINQGGIYGLNYGANSYGINYGADVSSAYNGGFGDFYGSEVAVAAPVFATPVITEAVQPASYILPYPAPSCAFIPTLGPRSPALPVIRTPDVVTPEASKVVDLPAPIVPPTRVVSNTCSCSKKIVKDQVYEQVVRIPSTIRYIKKSYVPVEEKIRYCANGKVGVEAAAPRSGDVSILPFPFPITRPSCGCN